MKIAVSILNCPVPEDEIIAKINESNADAFHVDINDGKFLPVPKNEYKFLHTATKPLNVHLMVSDPFEYISYFASLKVDKIIFNVELDENIDELLDYIKSKGIKCGLAIKPETSVSSIKKYLSKLDAVLILSIIPGKSGQPMIISTLDKIDELKELRRTNGFNYDIIIDGGINDTTIELVRKKGADMIVSGSFIWKSEDIQAQIDKLRG